ncbi:MAG: hypothetical protein U0797_22065 [Gemmataceae bacterium]
MKRMYYLAGVGVLTACLAGWAAFASAQSLPGGAPPVPEMPPPGASAPVPPSAPGAVLPPGPAAPAPLPPSPLPPAPGPSAAPEVEPHKAIPTPAVPAPSPEPTRPLSMPQPPSMASETTPPVPGGMTPPSPAPLPPGPTTAAKPAVPEQPPEVPLTAETATGRQEPSVSLEWVGNPIAKVGAPADYSLVVRNICNIPVQQVAVRVRVPAGLSVQGTEPRADNAGGILTWDLGTLMAKQERVLQLKLQADTKGDVTPQAWVTFTGSSVLRIRVREPKLMLKCAASEKVLVGDAAAFTLTVSNPGDGSADVVKIKAVLSEGLEHARGNKIDFDIGNLAPGESRNVTLLCATRAGGAQKCEAEAAAEGGLVAKDTATLNVIMPRLDLQVVGPRLRYLDRKAIYSLKVTNPGDAPASNVTVADMVPAGFKVLAASDGGRHDFQTRTVSWFLGEVGPGQTREVKLEVQAVNPGEHEHKATAVGARGLRAESKLQTRVEGLAALLVEMVDTEDPIEAGADTAYEVRITNTGSKTEENIKLVATVPDKMQFKNAQGPVRYQEQGKTIVFEPIPALAPRADAIFRINVKALEAGTERFKIHVTSANLTDPVVKMEATRIYSDAPEPATSTPVTPPAAAPAPLVPPAAPGAIPAPPAPGRAPKLLGEAAQPGWTSRW